MKYIYPAIFTKEENGYSVNFPDVESCYTQGDNLEDALDMAEDVLALRLYEYERTDSTIPKPTDVKKLETDEVSFVTLVKADTMEYRKRFRNKAVKKTLTIPEWMNEEAVALNLNFSKILQEALLRAIDIR